MRVSGACPSTFLAAPPGGLGRCRRAVRKLLANQNLLHLVFKWLMNTKDSEGRAEWQGFFVPQEGVPKSGTKTADCRASFDLSKVFPPAMHRFVHKRAGRRTVSVALQFCDSEIMRQRNIGNDADVDRCQGGAPIRSPALSSETRVVGAKAPVAPGCAPLNAGLRIGARPRKSEQRAAGDSHHPFVGCRRDWRQAREPTEGREEGAPPSTKHGSRTESWPSPTRTAGWTCPHRA